MITGQVAEVVFSLGHAEEVVFSQVTSQRLHSHRSCSKGDILTGHVAEVVLSQVRQQRSYYHRANRQDPFEQYLSSFL